MPKGIYTRKPAQTFVGKPCVKCDSNLRYVKQKRCVACYKVYDQSFNRKLSHRLRELERNRTPKFKEYRKSPEYVISRRERDRSPEQHAYKKWYRRHSPKWKIYKTSSKRRAIERASSQKRRALFKNLEGSYTAQEWINLKERYGNICLCCKLHQSELDRPLEQDHIIPVTKPGSTNWITNIQPLCHDCNGMGGKGTKIIDYRPKMVHPNFI